MMERQVSNMRRMTATAALGLLLGLGACSAEEVTEQPTPAVTATAEQPAAAPTPEPTQTKAELGTRENPLLPGNSTALVKPDAKSSASFVLNGTEVRDGMTIGHFTATVDWATFSERNPDEDTFEPMLMGFVSLVLADGTIDETYDGDNWDSLPADWYPAGIMPPATSVTFSSVVDEHDITNAVWKLELFTVTYYFAAG